MSNSQPNFQDDLLDGLLSDFLDESDQLLVQLNENLLQLDEWVQSLENDHQQPCDADLLNEMFRAAHSIKGLSAMLGLTDINHLTHKIENVFDAARKHELAVNGDVTELIFTGLDHLTALISLLKQPGAESVDCEPVLTSISRMLESAGVNRQASTQADAERALADTTSRADEPAQAVATPGAAGAEPSQPADPFADVCDEQEICEKYLAIFIDETHESLDLWTSTLVSPEHGGIDDLRRLMGIAHKIKGSAAATGLNRIAKCAHLVEDLLQMLVEAEVSLSEDLTDLLLKSSDALQQALLDLRQGKDNTDHFRELAKELLEAQSGLASRRPVKPTSSATEPTALAALTDVPGTPQPHGSLGGSLRARLESVLIELRQWLGAGDARAIASATGMGLKTVERVRAGENVKLESVRALAAYFDATSEQRRPMTTFRGQVQFPPSLTAAGLKAQLIYEKLARRGIVTHCEPAVSELDDIDELPRFRFQVMTDRSEEELLEAIDVADVLDATVEPVDSASRPFFEEPKAAALPSPSPADLNADDASRNASGGTAAKAAASESSPQNAAAATGASRPAAKATASSDGKPRGVEAASRPTETVRVDIDRLDQLMNLAGELVISRAQLSQIGDKLKTVLQCKHSVAALDKVSAELERMGNQDVLRIDQGHTSAAIDLIRSHTRRIQNDLEPLRREVRTISHARDFIRELSEALHQLNRVSDGIQQSVMDTRMVPIGPLFMRFKRVVRDITRAGGKDVRLEILGEKTELDKRMIDELGDPLVHMVRNSADHGIELPDQREAAGKPRQGTVTLNAYHRGNNIVIEVRDDGRGLDADKILLKCLDKGLITKADAEKMTPHQIYQMIWEPGLSTAEKVTEISGRGMGMDIVKSKIEELSGTVDIDSAPGEGTTISIRLPLTLAILPSLMVDIGGDVFAMPMETVIEIVSVEPEQVTTAHGRQMATVRGRPVSLVRLGDMLHFQRGAAAEEAREMTLVIVGERGGEVGLIVDHVIGEEDVVIKSLSENFKNIVGIAGASILGDGRVSLILDIPALIEMIGSRTGGAVARAEMV